ncbi:MAG: NUDIX domain-containing protein [Desulfococcaceae bacterium]
MSSRYRHCIYCGTRFAPSAPWPRPCPGCGELNYRNPLPVAVAMVPVDEGLLLIRRGILPARGKWALPGGFIDWGESWQTAAAREVQEEAGISIDPEELTEFRVRCTSDGFALVFGLARPRRSEELSRYRATDETTDRRVWNQVPSEMAFDLHAEMMRRYFAEQDWKREERPRVGVGVIVRRNGKILLGRRRGTHGAGAWALPGGHLEFGETPEACAAREVREETGLRIENPRRGPFTNDFFTDAGLHYVTIYVMAEWAGGEPEVREPHRCREWGWFSRHALPAPRFPSLRNLMASGFDPFGGSP